MPDPHPSRRRPRALAALAMVVALVAFPLGALASHQYSDVPDSNPFHGDITAITNAGITSGCGGGNYCPDRNVTRAEMAAFMNRLGALASNKTPVVNATKVDGYSAGDLSRVASNATHSLVSGSATSGTLSWGIVTPGVGYLVISGNAQISNLTAGTNAHAACELKIDDGPTLPGSYQQTSVGEVNGLENWVQQCTTQAVYEVCAAGTYMVHLPVQVSSSVADVGAASLVVQYVPFGNTGLPPACTSS